MLSAAQLSKEKGNDAFRKGDYLSAHDHYADAILADPAEYSYPLNKAMANLKLERWQEAEHDATTALKLSPGDLKAYFRRCVARREQGDFLGARQDIEAFANAGGNKNVTDEQRTLIVAAEKSSMPSSVAADSALPIPCGFIVADAPGKGQGAFATQPFHRGDLILAERPLFVVDNSDNGGRANQRNVIAAVQRLSEADMKQFHSLKNGHVGNPLFGPILGIQSSNAFAVGESESAICLLASRFNHSCSPNARYSWHAASGRLRIFILREIATGEEICVSYLSGRHVYGSSRKNRQARLKAYGFICSCIVCALQHPEDDESDRRRVEIARIWESVPYYGPRQTTDRLRAIVRALRLLEEEGYCADSDDFTNDAATICACYSDWESTKYWATKTYETRVAEFGEDSHRAAEVRSLYLNPQSSPRAATQRKQKFTVRL